MKNSNYLPQEILVDFSDLRFIYLDHLNFINVKENSILSNKVPSEEYGQIYKEIVHTRKYY